MKFGSPEAIRFTKGLVLTALFIGLICLPTFDSLFALDHAPIPNEKRLLAPFPKYTGLWQLRGFTANLNQFFDDHFGFRRRLIRANNHWKRQLFHTPPLDMILGRNGWLFTSNGGMLDHYLGFSRFSQKDLDAWQQLLEKRQSWLASRGCKYLFVVAPDKQSVYPEFFPESLVRSTKPSKIRQFIQHMKAHSTVPVLDLTEKLDESKNLGPLFLKTDTHWNNFGGFLAYQAVVDSLAGDCGDLKPLALSAFTRTPTIGPLGDLGSMLGDATAVETQQFLLVPAVTLPTVETLTQTDRLPKHWKKLTEPTVTVNEAAKRKAILFHDSFATTWRPFLACNFHEVVYIWQYEFDPAFLEREKPDIVISEIVERFFNQEDPKELMVKDGLE